MYVLRRLLAKCVLSVIKGVAQEACGIDQLCGRLQAGIGSGVMGDTEDGRGMGIPARNAFHEINHTVMLWVMHHKFLSGAPFCFNCYLHHALLVNHGAIGKTVIISNQEGVAQRDPLSMR